MTACTTCTGVFLYTAEKLTAFKASLCRMSTIKAVAYEIMVSEIKAQAASIQKLYVFSTDVDKFYRTYKSITVWEYCIIEEYI